MNTEKLKSLIRTKFLFDKNIISYEDLVNLLRTSGLYTDFIQKPIKDNLDVHSLFIKSGFEVSYLVKSEQADEYYKNAGLGYVDYKEITLQEVLDVLGYSVPDKEDQKEKKSKKQKYITLTNNETEYTIKKNKIVYICYNKNSNKIYFRFKNDCIESFYIPEEKYLEIKEMLES